MMRVNVLRVLLQCAIFFVNYLNADHISNETVCETILDDSLWEEMNLNGNCELYAGTKQDRVSPCDKYFTVGVDYVYILDSRLNGDQAELRDVVEEIGTKLIFVSDTCRDPIEKMLCYHLYLPCGTNSTFVLPRFICPDVCSYISNTLCPVEWEQGRTLTEYRNDLGVQLVNCSHPDMQISFLNLTEDCCIDVGIVLPTKVVSTEQFTSSIITSSVADSSNTPDPTNSQTSKIISIVLPVVTIIIIAVASLFIVLGVFICRKYKRKQIPINTHHSRTAIKTNGYVTAITYGYPNASHINSNDQMTSVVSDCHQPWHGISCKVLKKLSNNIIPGSNVKLMELIGQGEFGRVYRGILSSENEIPTAVAIKTLKGAFSENDIHEIIEETLKMKKFDHFNVLSLIGVCLDLTEAPCIIMPYMSEGSLLSYLKRERPQLNIAENALVDDEVVDNVTKQLLSMCLQVANGMEYLSKEKFVHRDLAARNCMLSVDGVVKVTDFGLSEDVYAKHYFRLNIDNPQKTQVKLPIKWMALESIHDGLFSEKTDVWSYGILCWEVFSLGKVPYPGLSPKEVVDCLDSGQRLDKPKNLACTKNIFTFITSCWNEKPDDRMSFTAIVSSVNDLIKPVAGYMEFKQFFSRRKTRVKKNVVCNSSTD